MYFYKNKYFKAGLFLILPQDLAVSGSYRCSTNTWWSKYILLTYSNLGRWLHKSAKVDQDSLTSVACPELLQPFSCKPSLPFAQNLCSRKAVKYDILLLYHFSWVYGVAGSSEEATLRSQGTRGRLWENKCLLKLAQI